MEDTNVQLDPQAVNLAKAIRQVETGGNANAKGASGEYGAYQFMPQTWDTLSKKYGVNTPLEKSTLEEQNKVAYSQIKEWKDAGYNPDAIASMWNSGKPKYEGNVGVNSKGVKYDVPRYVASVGKAYQSIKGGETPGVDANNPSSTAGTQTVPQGNNYGASFPATGDEGLVSGGLKAIGNIPSSAVNLGKNLLNVAEHPIKTIEGLGNTAVGGAERFAGLLTGNQPQTDQTKQFDNVVDALKDRYGSLSNIKKTIINDPTGVALDVASVMEGGGALVKGASLLGDSADIAELTAGMSGAEKSAFISELSKAGALGSGAEVGQGLINAGSAINPINIAGKGVKLAAKGIGRLTSDTLGTITGTSGNTIREGLKASSEGGDAYDAFKEGLKGNVSPDDLVTQAQQALKDVVDNRNSSYQDMLDNLKGDQTVYNPTPISDELSTQLDKFGIKESVDGLDFSRSKFALDTAAQNDINNLYQYIKTWGQKDGDLSAVGVDNLKKIIGSYYTPNSDYRAMTTALRNSAKDVLENAPGYTDEMKNYADATEWIDDTRKGLSLGDNAMVETAFKKLTGAFKQNNEWRAQALQELDDVTGGQLKAKIAGQQLSSIIPRGLAKFGTGLEAIESAKSLLSGGGGIIPLLGTMIISSPKLVGTFLKGLGLGAQGVAIVMQYLQKVNPGNVAEVANVGSKLSTPGLLSK